MAAPLTDPHAELLQAVLGELQQLNELLEAFTNDGFPLARSVPSTEVLAAITVAAALLMRHDPRIDPRDLQQRLAAAPVISNQLIQQVDAYLQSMQRQQLEQLRMQS